MSESTTGNEIDPGGVKHPAHYNMHPSGVECIDIIKHHNLCVGTAIKYLWRQGLKDGEPSEKDLRKAIEYIEFELARIAEPDPMWCSCKHGNFLRGAPVPTCSLCGRPVKNVPAEIVDLIK